MAKSMIKQVNGEYRYSGGQASAEQTNSLLISILRHFPSQVYPLTLVHDPDQILIDEAILATLMERGFRVMQADADTVLLQVALASITPPFTINDPLIIVTANPLNQLPYSLWQQGQLVTVALHTFFPTLSYPVLQTLSVNQRWGLGQLTSPVNSLGRQATIAFLLSHLFAVIWEELATPAGVISWLNQYHQQEPMPALLAEQWLTEVKAINPEVAAWPLRDFLQNREQFNQFVTSSWQVYIDEITGKIGESKPVYTLAFQKDAQLQDALSSLVRDGAIQPILLREAEDLPTWARTGVHASEQAYARKRVDALLDSLQAYWLNSTEARWAQWQSTAVVWAELTVWANHPERYLTSVQQAAVIRWQNELDHSFADWIKRNYAPLANQIVPHPHHLYHTPHFMAYERRQAGGGRTVLLVLDGMSLANWQIIEKVWRKRQPEWAWQTQLLLAQIPTITAVSRQALIGGKRPFDFAKTITHNRKEGKLWSSFWTREGLPPSACAYERLSLARPIPDVVYRNDVQALCFIYNGIDDMVHGSSQGLSDMHASLRVWLNGSQSKQLEIIIEELHIT